MKHVVPWLLCFFATFASGCYEGPQATTPTTALPDSAGNLTSGDFGPRTLGTASGEEVDQSFLDRYAALQPQYGAQMLPPAPPLGAIPQALGAVKGFPHFWIPVQIWLDGDTMTHRFYNPGQFKPAQP